MKAIIYQPAKNAMQSGKAKTKHWILRLPVSQNARMIDPLMGWTSNNDTTNQLRLNFASKDEAVAYATARHIEYDLKEPNTAAPKIRPYAGNFTG